MSDVTITLQSAPSSQWRDIWDQFKTHRGALFGAIFFLFIMGAVFLGPFVWTIDPQYIDILSRDQGMSLAHPMGTDQLGRDTLARILVGGQTTVAVGITAMLLSLVLGTLVGVLAGFVKWMDGPLMRLTDLFLALANPSPLARYHLAIQGSVEGSLWTRNRYIHPNCLCYRDYQLDAGSKDCQG